MTADRELAAHLASIAGDLHGESTEGLTFAMIVRRGIDVVPACDAASVTLRRGRKVETVGSSDPSVDVLDALQYSFGEGPCLDAAFERSVMITTDIATETRWPRWVEGARDAGVTGVIAVRLHTATETLGALNLYSFTPTGFDADAIDVASIFAAHATDAMSKARLVGGLEAALETRHTIGIAQGILAMRYGIDYDTAFEVLQRYSNDTNTKLREVAARVLLERDVPSTEASAPVIGIREP